MRLTRAILAAIALAAVAGCSGSKEPPAPAATPVRVAEIRQIDLAEQITYLGTVRSAQEVLVTARIQGSVAQLPRRAGERVAGGETVVRLSAPDLDAAAERLRADDIYWSSRLAADRRLAQRGAIAQEQVAATTRAAAAASAALAEVEARRDGLQETAPLDGVVLAWRVEAGQHVLPGQPLIVLGGDVQEIRVPVVEEDLRRGIRTGTRATVTTGENVSFTTAVSEVAPLAEGAGRTFTVTMSVPAEHARSLRSGESARVHFLLRESPNAVAVPVRALIPDGDTPHIYLVSDGRARRWLVSPGVQQDGWVAVTPPPAVGARVAVSNLEALVDGAVVYAVIDTEVRP